jgi:plastocyanin
MKSLIISLKRVLVANAAVSLATLTLIAGIASFFAVQAIATPNNVSGSSRCDGVCVALTSTGMNPSELAVKVGEYVQFNSADGQSHNIAEGDGVDHDDHDGSGHHDHVGGLISGEFGADEAWRVQFKQPGTYKLHDHLHPNQRILIVVYEDKAGQ